MVFIGADHRGYPLKEFITHQFQSDGIEFTDLGNDHFDPQDDYVIFSKRVADEVSKNTSNRGIVICGSGIGVDIVANKVDAIRCALVSDIERAIESREHEDVNMIALSADTLDKETAYKIIKLFLQTEFSGEERHLRRLNELKQVEEEH